MTATSLLELFILLLWVLAINWCQPAQLDILMMTLRTPFGKRGEQKGLPRGKAKALHELRTFARFAWKHSRIVRSCCVFHANMCFMIFVWRPGCKGRAVAPNVDQPSMLPWMLHRKLQLHVGKMAIGEELSWQISEVCFILLENSYWERWQKHVVPLLLLNGPVWWTSSVQDIKPVSDASWTWRNNGFSQCWAFETTQKTRLHAATPSTSWQWSLPGEKKYSKYL